jgi:hypothetical protein
MKVNIYPVTLHVGTSKGVQAQSFSSFNLGTRWGGWSALRLCRFPRGKKTPVSILQEAWKVSRWVWTVPWGSNPVASRYTDHAIPSRTIYAYRKIKPLEGTDAKSVAEKIYGNYTNQFIALSREWSFADKTSPVKNDVVINPYIITFWICSLTSPLVCCALKYL